MREIYNKSALDNIATQRQLDRMVTLVSPAIWASVIGAFAIVAGLLIWGCFGSIPSSSDASGIYMKQSGFQGVYAEKTGILSSYHVSAEETVEEGDVVATLASEDDYYKLQQLDMRISYVENITFDSDFSVVTSDSEPLAAIKLKLVSVGTDKLASEAQLQLKADRLAELSGTVKAREKEVLKYKEDYYGSLSISDNEAEVKYSESEADYNTHFSLYEQAKNAYISASETYNAKRNEFDKQYEHFNSDSATPEELASYDAAMQAVQDAADQMADMKVLMDAEEVKLNRANDNLEAARKEYLEHLNSQSGVQADNTIAYTEYTEALSAYNTALSEYRSLRGQVDELEVKLAMDDVSADNDETTLRQQFSNQKAAILFDLQRQRNDLLNELARGNIVAEASGTVYRLDLTVGMQISAGTQVAAIVPEEREEDTVICYVPLKQVMNLEEGMEVHLFPSTINKHEYGYVLGNIRTIDAYVETPTRIKEQLDNESLAEQFSKQGSVVAVYCSLQPDPSTASGYKWSSEKGKSIDIVSGTYVDATFITGRKRPLDVFIPYIKEKLEFSTEKNE